MADDYPPPHIQAGQETSMYPPIYPAGTPVATSGPFGAPQPIHHSGYPTPGTPTQVMNPLGAISSPGSAVSMPMMPTVIASPMQIMRSVSGKELMSAAQKFLKPLKCCHCITTGRHELLVAPGQVVADRKGCFCNYKREVLSAKDVTSWGMQTTTKCGGKFCCCPGEAGMQVRAGPNAETVHLNLSVQDLLPTGPVHASVRNAVNADKKSPIVTNDGGRIYTAAACICCCFDVTDRLTLGGAGTYDVTGVRTESGCFQSHTDVQATQVPDVDYTKAVTSMGMCACIQSNAGCCHCGEQLEVGIRDTHVMRLLFTKGTAKEAVTELYRRNRHPMMPEPQPVRKISGTTNCCGLDSELVLTTESVGLTSLRYPTGCSLLSPCQVQSTTTISLDDVRVVRVEDESPCTEAERTMKRVPRVMQLAIASLLFLDIWAFLALFGTAFMSIPLSIYQCIGGLLCLPCRRSLVVVDGPADLAFRIRPGKDTEDGSIDFAAELQAELRMLKAQRAALMLGATTGAGKDQVLFTSVVNSV